MKYRRGSRYFKTDKRLINQFEVGDYVLSTFMVIGDSLKGVVTAVNKAENKVYVAWNGGNVKQHEPDELMLSVEKVQIDQEAGRKMQETVEENPTTEDKTVTASIGRRMAGNPNMEKFMGDPDIHGLDEPISGGSNVMQNLVEDLREESNKLQGERISHRRVALYYKQKGRYYKRTRSEENEKMFCCPKDGEVLERQNFTKSTKLLVCPKCGWKITTDNIL